MFGTNLINNLNEILIICLKIKLRIIIKRCRLLN